MPLSARIKNRAPVRILALAAATVLAAAGAMAATGSAQAAPAKPNPISRIPTLPPAPADAHPLSAAAVSPTISPAAQNTFHVNPGAPWVCGSGLLCVAVWDYTTGNWKQFNLFTCAKYSLSNWLDSGEYLDHQTGNVLSHFYNQDGSVRKSFRPDYPTVHSQNWTPVWSIRNC
ncbi:MAG TPA: hypothetical protein VF069_21370 [Streptosporangiaceae bacterium]